MSGWGYILFSPWPMVAQKNVQSSDISAMDIVSLYDLNLVPCYSRQHSHIPPTFKSYIETYLYRVVNFYSKFPQLAYWGSEVECENSYSWLGSPSPTTNQENSAQICLQAKWVETLNVSPLQMIIAYVKLEN